MQMLQSLLTLILIFYFTVWLLEDKDKENTNITEYSIEQTPNSSAVTLPSNYYVSAQRLNVRSHPSLNGKVLGVLTKGEKVEVLKVSGDWVRVSQNFSSNKVSQLENVNLWVYSKYLSVNSVNLKTQAVAHGSKNKPLPIVMDGKLISLDYKDIEIRHLLEMIAKSGNYTISVSQNIQGTISLKYNNELWDTVFYDVINKTGLHFSRDDDRRNIFVFR